MVRPTMMAPLLLDLRLKSADGSVAYGGSVELPEGQFSISVEVAADVTAADGLGCTASAPEIADADRQGVERLAAAVARKAVRAARKDGLRPPRRIRRWRSMPRSGK